MAFISIVIAAAFRGYGKHPVHQALKWIGTQVS